MEHENCIKNCEIKEKEKVTPIPVQDCIPICNCSGECGNVNDIIEGNGIDIEKDESNNATISIKENVLEDISGLKEETKQNTNDIVGIVATIKSYATKVHGLQNLSSMIVDYLNPQNYYAVKLDAEIDTSNFSAFERALIISVARIVATENFKVNTFGIVGARLTRSSARMSQNFDEWLLVGNPAGLSSFAISSRESQQYIYDKTDSWYVYFKADDEDGDYNYAELDAIMLIRSFCTYTVDDVETTFYGNALRYEHKGHILSFIPEGELPNYGLNTGKSLVQKSAYENEIIATMSAEEVDK